MRARLEQIHNKAAQRKKRANSEEISQSQGSIRRSNSGEPAGRSGGSNSYQQYNQSTYKSVNDESSESKTSRGLDQKSNEDAMFKRDQMAKSRSEVVGYGKSKRQLAGKEDDEDEG